MVLSTEFVFLYESSSQEEDREKLEISSSWKNS